MKLEQAFVIDGKKVTKAGTIGHIEIFETDCISVYYIVDDGEVLGELHCGMGQGIGFITDVIDYSDEEDNE